jgi:hypothetical protein
MHKFLKTLHTYTLVGFEPGILCSVGGREDHHTLPPGQFLSFLILPQQDDQMFCEKNTQNQ